MQSLKPKVLIRVDSYSEIGSGHAMRMLALASMLKGEFDLYLAFKKMPELAKQLYLDAQVTLINLNEIGSHSESDYFLNILKDFDIAVVDGYEELDDFKKICIESKIKLVLIDDLLINDFEADLIINHCPGLNQNDFAELKKTTLCLGLDYALIQQGFIKQAKSKVNLLDKRNGIFLNLGGSDPRNITPNLINFILKGTTEKISCVLGPLNKNSELIKNKFKNDNSRIVFFNNISSDDIRNLMLSSRLGLCSASTISIEALSCRLPLIVGWSAKNQYRFYKEICNSGLAKGIGNFDEPDLDILLTSLEELIFSKEIRNTMIKKQIKHLDGKSNERVIKALKSLI